MKDNFIEFTQGDKKMEKWMARIKKDAKMTKWEQAVAEQKEKLDELLQKGYGYFVVDYITYKNRFSYYETVLDSYDKHDKTISIVAKEEDYRKRMEMSEEEIRRDFMEKLMFAGGSMKRMSYKEYKDTFDSKNQETVPYSYDKEHKTIDVVNKTDVIVMKSELYS